MDDLVEQLSAHEKERIERGETQDESMWRSRMPALASTLSERHHRRRHQCNHDVTDFFAPPPCHLCPMLRPSGWGKHRRSLEKWPDENAQHRSCKCKRPRSKRSRKPPEGTQQRERHCRPDHGPAHIEDVLECSPLILRVRIERVTKKLNSHARHQRASED